MTTEKTPHRWADVLRAIADGEEVQFWNTEFKEWVTWSIVTQDPLNYPEQQWRIAPKKQTVWVNVYPYACLDSVGFSSKEEADKNAGIIRIACIPITFTEGEGL